MRKWMIAALLVMVIGVPLRAQERLNSQERRALTAKAADRLARRRRISRSELYAEALAKLLDSDESTEITERLDDVYGDRSSELDPDLAVLQAVAIAEDW